jgi:hypothetical protein
MHHGVQLCPMSGRRSEDRWGASTSTKDWLLVGIRLQRCCTSACCTDSPTVSFDASGGLGAIAEGAGGDLGGALRGPAFGSHRRSAGPDPLRRMAGLSWAWLGRARAEKPSHGGSESSQQAKQGDGCQATLVQVTARRYTRGGVPPSSLGHDRCHLLDSRPSHGRGRRGPRAPGPVLAIQRVP